MSWLKFLLPFLGLTTLLTSCEIFNTGISFSLDSQKSSLREIRTLRKNSRVFKIINAFQYPPTTPDSSSNNKKYDLSSKEIRQIRVLLNDMLYAVRRVEVKRGNAKVRPVRIRITESEDISVNAKCKEGKIDIPINLIRRIVEISLENYSALASESDGWEFQMEWKPNNSYSEFMYYLYSYDPSPIEKNSWGDTNYGFPSPSDVSPYLRIRTDFIATEIYKFLAFVLGHEYYHIKKEEKCKVSANSEKEADIYGYELYSYFFSDIANESIRDIFGGDMSKLTGRDFTDIFSTIYKETPFEKETALYLSLEDRIKNINEYINSNN